MYLYLSIYIYIYVFIETGLEVIKNKKFSHLLWGGVVLEYKDFCTVYISFTRIFYYYFKK